MKPNKLKIPTAYLGINDEAGHLFNEIYDWAKSEEMNSLYTTPSGGIGYKGLRLPAWLLYKDSKCVGMYLLLAEGMWNVKFYVEPISPEEGTVFYPQEALKLFSERCLIEGLDLNSYAIEDGAEVKSTIEPAMIKMTSRYLGGERNIYTAHHIDFHSSYMGGLAITHPEFKPVVDFFYDKRKDNEGYKSVLNKTFGMFQTDKCGIHYKWAHLARDMVKNNNDRIRELSNRLREAGNTILLYNTDGLWYTGDIYHGDGEGDRPGQWSNDHVNCKFRMKSAGSYEYIEDNIYHPVQRGTTHLDKIKPRDEWEWGDIFRKDCETLEYYWDDGIYNKEGVRL